MNKTIIWDPQQLAVFDWFKSGRGNIIIEAVAGGGKTTTLVEGLHRADEDNSAYVVFGKRNQLEAVPKIKNQSIKVITAHSLGCRTITPIWRGLRFDYQCKWKEYSRIEELSPKAPKQIIFLTAQLVSYLKNVALAPDFNFVRDTAIAKGIGPEKNDKWTLEQMCDLAMQSLELSKSYPKDKRISFDDMVWLPNVLNLVRPVFPLVVVDEVQDMNYLQLLIAIGSCFNNGRICLVGDRNQSIYAFRGAMLDGMDVFKQKTNATEYPLSISYRCPKKVIALAQLEVPTIQARADAPEGTLETISEASAFNQIKIKDVILSRLNAPLMGHCLSLIRKNIPAYIVGKDIGEELIRIVKNLNAKNMDDFFNQLNIWETLKISRATGWTANEIVQLVQDQAATLRVLAESCVTLDDIENKIEKLFKEVNEVTNPAVIFSTVHKFKGMEAENIYLLSSTFNGGKKATTPQQAKQEKNIYHVAITRSKLNLYLVVDEKKKPKRNNTNSNSNTQNTNDKKDNDTEGQIQQIEEAQV